MTREQAKDKAPVWLSHLNPLKPRQQIKWLRYHIDEIYDDFESRTCKRCKHSGLYVMGWMPCLHPDNELIIKEVVDDFGCNKFERNGA